MQIEFPTIRELASRCSVFMHRDNAAYSAARDFGAGENRGRVWHAEELNVYVVTDRVARLRRTFPGLTLTEVQ